MARARSTKKSPVRAGKSASTSARAAAGKGARSASKSKGVTGRSGGKSAGKRASARQPARRTAAPKRIGTGRGPGAAEIGKDFVTRVNLGQFQEIYDAWYHPSRVESIEGDGQMWRGMKGIQAKNQWWGENHEIHACTAEGPFVGASGFAVRYTMSFSPKGGQRIDMTEVGVYTVKDGKIVREEYMYHMGNC